MGFVPAAGRLARAIVPMGRRGFASEPSPWRRIALVFPGQGAQHPGMGRAILDQFPYTRLVFEEVEEASQLSLRRIMFEGDEVGRREATRGTAPPAPTRALAFAQNALRSTAVTQPALLCHSVAALRVLEVGSMSAPRPPRAAPQANDPRSCGR